MVLRHSDGLVQFKQPVPGVVTTKQFGDFSGLKTARTKLPIAHLIEEHKVLGTLLFALGVSPEEPLNVWRPVFEHNNAVVFIGADSEKHHDSGFMRVMAGDGILLELPSRNRRRNVLVSLSADCPTAVIKAEHERGKRVCFGIFHLGWRSLARGIIANGFKILEKKGYSAKDCQILITVGIGPCCFGVGGDVLEAFQALLPKKNFPYVYRTAKNGQTSIDLLAAAIDLFRQEGILYGKIRNMEGCTHCSTIKVGRKNDFLWFSHRRKEEARFAIAFAV